VVDDGTWEEVPPDPAATIESLRSLGYTPGSAVADLIDNSVAAGAGEVRVIAKWADDDSWIAVIDDGEGMSEDRLRRAMRIGSDDPLDLRSERDLGRFGFGLKTASFSQARELTVLTRRSGARTWAARSWDLDHVRRTGRWMLRKSCPPEAEPLVERLDNSGHGTVVLWRRLTTVGATMEGDASVRQREFRRHLAEITSHLGMVFGRFIARSGLTIDVGRHRVRGWDPFLGGHEATQELPAEKLLLRGHSVVVRPFVLPHASKLSTAQCEAAAGPAGWNEQQGFYVFRKDRLVVAGDWLGLGLARDDLHNFARIAVDVPAELDDAWQLDVRKAAVRPPDGLRADLLRIARFTRQKAAAVNRHRGTPVTQKSSKSVEQLWVQRARHGSTRLTINRKHPFVAHVLKASGVRRDLSDLLAVLEQTIPVLLLPADRGDETPLEDRAPKDILRLAELVYETLLSSGLSRSEARQRLLNTEPFHLYPSVVGDLGRSQ
jgi:hypothetical protein